VFRKEKLTLVSSPPMMDGETKSDAKRETKSIPLPIKEERAPANNNNMKRERSAMID